MSLKKLLCRELLSQPYRKYSYTWDLALMLSFEVTIVGCVIITFDDILYKVSCC